MQSLDVIGSNIQKIAQLFPNCVTERLGKDGKPELFFSDSVKQILQNRCGECVVHVSLSHETDYAIAYVVIEKI